MNGHSQEVLDYLDAPPADEEEMMEELKLCDCCKRDFPEELLQPHFLGGPLAPDICPICTLKLSNLQHGLNRSEFYGAQANEMLREARAYLIEQLPKKWLSNCCGAPPAYGQSPEETDYCSQCGEHCTYEETDGRE